MEGVRKEPLLLKHEKDIDRKGLDTLDKFGQLL
jgi:hypothetical protein